MNSFRKYGLGIIILSMIMPLFSGITLGKDLPQPQTQAVLYSEDFDGYNDGDIPTTAEWHQGTGNYDPQVFEVDDDQQWQSAPNSLWMKSWSSWFAFCRYTNSTSFSDYTITFDIYINASNGLYYFSTTEGTNEWHQEQSLHQQVFRLQFMADGTIKYNSGGWIDTGMTYTVGWYNFTIRHNDTDDKVDIWINNNHIMNWANYRWACDGIRGMHFGISASGSVIRDIFIDNFKIESEELPQPQFSNVIITPDSAEYDVDYVNITCNITNGVGIDSAYVNITGLGNYSMVQGSGDIWYLNQTYSKLGTNSFFITANDTSNNWNNTGNFSFIIYDTLAPQITLISVSPVPQEYDEAVNVTATIQNHVAVSSAYVNITGLGNYSMVQGSGYLWHFNQSLSAPVDIYTFHIASNDTSNNWNNSGVYFFELKDTTPPEIINIVSTPNEIESGCNMNITAEVTDFSGVNATIIHLQIITPIGTTNHTMTKGSGDEYYYNNTFVLNSEVQYLLWSNDSWDNVNQSGWSSFWVNDTTPPDLDVLYTPSTETTRTDSINITFNITDLGDIDEVWINLFYPDGSSQNISMKEGVDGWFFNQTFDDVGEYHYFIVAKDSSNNWGRSSEYSFEIEMTQNDFIWSLILFLAIMFGAIVVTKGVLYGDKFGVERRK